jgi:hypothetical protein
MADRTDLVHRVLRNLGVLPQGQSPSAEEYQSISDIADWVIADLQNRNIINSSISADYPGEENILQLALIIAWRASAEFGQELNTGLTAQAVHAEQQLKDVKVRDDIEAHRSTMRSDYPTGCRPLTGTSWTNG